MPDTYAEFIESPDVCRNCFSIIRVERIDPFRSTPQLGTDDKIATQYERHRQQTTVEYGPADEPPHSKGVFCNCGVEEARHRLWDADDCPRHKFKRFIQNAIRSLERKGISINHRTFARTALQARDNGKDVDQSLAVATDAAIVAEVSADT